MLDRLVHAYNTRIHSALFGMSPSEVAEENQVTLWNKMYVNDGRTKVRRSVGSNQTKTARKFKYKVGDLVRVSLLKKTFERAFTQKFSEQIYRIAGRLRRENMPIYYCKACLAI